MSEVKVNKISPRTNCGTVTLGDSGDTFSIPAGVTLTNSGTATGFGPTGAVSWNTTKITADPNPAVSGVGYFADTSSAAFTVTLPAAPSAGDIVGIRDYAQTFATNNLTVGRNSQPIDGQTFDLILNTNGIAINLVYVDVTQGWKSVSSNEIVNQAEFITATGGTVTCCGDYKIHTFTGPGTFTVTGGGNAAGSNSVDYLIVAGGGGGGSNQCGNGGGAGGGAGGYRESKEACAPWSASPLASSTSLPVSATAYPITVGGGGSGGTNPNRGTAGSNSVFSTITSTGGGGGGTGGPSAPQKNGGSGGSGGGAGSDGGSNIGGTGNTPPASPPQGNNGGDNSSGSKGAGGGGAGGAGGSMSDPIASCASTGAGGSGVTTSISASPTAYAGGGGAGAYTGNSGGGAPGGVGGGGNGADFGNDGSVNGSNGSTNTGGGAGGGGSNPGNGSGGTGGSGIVIIRYKYQ